MKFKVGMSYVQTIFQSVLKKVKIVKVPLRALVMSGVALIIVGVGVMVFQRFDEDTFNFSTDNDQIVSAEISQGLPIVVHVPDDFDVSVQKGVPEIQFTPAIDGSWNQPEGTAENTFVYYPKKQLVIGDVYQLALSSEEDTRMKRNFKIVAQPRLVNVFPLDGAEANIQSEITLVFNRPMVPLTTLDNLDTTGLVELSPKTDGKWKWISSRTLQFQPTNGLIGSSTYTVKTTDKLSSFDGAKIESSKSTFTTTNLRYQGGSNQIVNYNEPYIIQFNQPVDIEKTKAHISVTEGESNKKISIVVEYGKMKKKNEETGKSEYVTDKSSIAVYQTRDSIGREKFWDMSKTYSIKYGEAYPVLGDIIFNEKVETVFSTSSLLAETTAQSPRSPYASIDYFDVKGELILAFNEAIDLKKSVIMSSEMKKVDYVMECDESQDISYSDTGEVKCEKIPNKMKLQVTMKDASLPPMSKIKVSLEKIINEKGVRIDADDEPLVLTTPPSFEIKSVRYKAASPKQVVVCSSNPLFTPKFEQTEDKKDSDKFENYITANRSVTLLGWQESFHVTQDNSKYMQCVPGQFSTSIDVGFEPQKSYDLKLKMKDVFGALGQTTTAFTSGALESYDRSFYPLQEYYTVTHPDRTKLAFAAKNIPYVNVEICKLNSLDALQLVNRSLDYRKTIDEAKCSNSKTVKIDIPGGYFKNNYFNLQLKDYIDAGAQKGHYLLSISNPEYKDYDGNMVREHSLVTITDMSVVEKEITSRESAYTEDSEKLPQSRKNSVNNLFWITDMRTLAPIKGTLVEIYSDDDASNLKKETEATSNAEGIAQVPMVVNHAGTIVTSKDGADSALIPTYQSALNWADNAYNVEKVYAYTDRPIYRPGDTVEIKGIYRLGYDGQYEFEVGKKIEVSVVNNDLNSVFTQSVTLSPYGTFTAKMILDKGASLGSYTIRAGSNTYMERARFDVEEYTPAAFKLETKQNKEEFISGDTLDLTVNASYYFGVPLEGGEVNYSVVSQDYFFDKYTDQYFNFGSGWYSCWYGCYTNDHYVTDGKAKIEKDGSAKIEEKLLLEGKSGDPVQGKIYTVYITVTSPTGQQISTQKSFIVHAGSAYIGINTDKYYAVVDQDVNVKLKSVNTEGKVISIKGARLEVNRVYWVYNQRKEVDGGFYYNSKKELKLYKEFNVKTNGDGDWSDVVRFKDAGEYELTAKYRDENGNLVTSTFSIYIGGKGVSEDETLVRPSNDTSLEIVNSDPGLDVGGSGEFVIKNPFKGPAKALVTIERGEVFSYDIVDVNESFYTYKFKVRNNYVPNVYASVVLLSPLEKNDGGLKYGSTQYKVGTSTKELHISVSTNKETYLPGESVELNFDVKDSAGKKVQSELSVAVVDMSVLALKGNPKKNPVKFFYDNFPLTVHTSANLKNLLHEIEIKGGKGGDGGEGLDKKKRGLFKDTALWVGVIETDENGHGSVSFTLPDNLTTWQIEALGITKGMLSGVEYDEISTQKKLSIVPLQPRFIVPGDRSFIGAKVFNQSDKKQKVTVKFNSDTLKNLSSESTSIALAKDESKVVYFEVKAPLNKESGKHTFILSAVNDELSDTVEKSISITRNLTSESTAISDVSKEAKVVESILLPKNVISDRGSLTINSSATLAVFLSKGLHGLLEVPYGCTEQVASKLEALATVKKAMNIKNIADVFKIDSINIDGEKYTLSEAVSRGVARILENQNSDGGFAFYNGWESNLAVTLSAMRALRKVDETFEPVRPSVIRSAGQYLIDEISNDDTYKNDVNSLIFVTMELNESKLFDSQVAALTSKIHTMTFAKKGNVHNMNSLALASLAHLLSPLPENFTEGEKDKIFTELESRLRIDSRGAYLPILGDPLWSYFESEQMDTAVMLDAITKSKSTFEMSDDMLRWLLKARSSDGAWGGTASTLSVVDAMADYMVAQGENEADFSLDVHVDGKSIATYDFSQKNLFDQKSELISPLKKLPISRLFGVEFIKNDKGGKTTNLYYDLGLTYFLSADKISARDEGFTISRELYAKGDKAMVTPISSAKVGDILHGRLKFVVPETRHNVAIENFIPAGTELVNMNLATESQMPTEDAYSDGSEYDGETVVDANYQSGLGEYKLYSEKEELRDDRIFLFNQNLEPGVYEYDYYVRALTPGTYSHLPANIFEMYTPENFGRTEGGMFEVKE